VKPGETLVEARSGSDVQIDRQIWFYEVTLLNLSKVRIRVFSGPFLIPQRVLVGIDNGTVAMEPRKWMALKRDTYTLPLSGTAFSADLGGSSKYSNENFED
ncbi:16613_t:CDS:2, partial [Funneliformis geosporum]